MSFGVDLTNKQERLLLESYMCFQWGLMEDAYEIMAVLIQEVVDNGEKIETTQEIVKIAAQCYNTRKRN